MGRGVRTVQRWEESLDLPVHRIGSGRRSPVFAFEHELRLWLQSTKVNDDAGEAQPRDGSVSRFPDPAVIRKSAELAQQFLAATQDHRRLMKELAENLQRLRQSRRELQDMRSYRGGNWTAGFPQAARNLQPEMHFQKRPYAAAG